MKKGGFVTDKFIESPICKSRQGFKGGVKASKRPYGTDVSEPMNLRLNVCIGHHDN